MHEYTVIDAVRSDAAHALWLADGSGENHVARATSVSPRVGSRLRGNAPALGFGLLLGAPIDQVFRVVFEVVHCTADEARRQVYGSLTF